VTQKGRNHSIKVLVWGGGIALAIICACAEIRPPSGGPPDRTPPRFVSSFPASGEIGVTGEAKIKIRFSEPVQAGTGPQVFISPRPSRKPKVKWHGDELSVSLPEALTPNQTYIIQVSAATADLRGNKLDSAVIIAFSTGNTIDSGIIAGQVTQNGSAAAGVAVALYAVSSDTVALAYDSLNADYMTGSNQKGAFEFRFLPNGLFRLVAFSDKNRNERFNPRTEPYGLPDRPVRVGGPLDLSHIGLEITTIDTALPLVLSAVHTQNKVVKVRLTKEIPLAYFRAHPDSTTLVDSAAHDIHYHLLAFAESEDSSSSNLTLQFGDIAEGVYELRLPYDSLKPVPVASRVPVKVGKDKESPTILSWRPGDRPPFVPAVKVGLTFSESIDTSGPSTGTLILTENDRDTVAINSRWLDPFHLSILPDKLRPGAKYRLDLFGAGFADRGGNSLADSLRSFRFSTLSEDSLGTIAGTIKATVPGRESDPVVLFLHDTKRKSKYRWSVASREFRFDVPAGKYLLSGFVDSDHDGARSSGTLSPFSPAESSANYPDTIAVRARFETAGIEFLLE